MSAAVSELCIPLPLQIVIDDVGWWEGADGHDRQEPFRSGMPRRHCLADYAAIVDLGRWLGMRPQAALVLCEWDHTGSLRQLPSATWMGTQWRCPPFDRREAAAVVELVNANPTAIEPVLHGVGHEFWIDGKLSRAEWCEKGGAMRPEEEVRRHLDAFYRLYHETGFNAAIEAFVPAAFVHRFGADGRGMARLLRERGIFLISTPFQTMIRERPTEHEFYGIEDGVLTADRGRDLVNWNVAAPEPAGETAGVICGMHWPQVLHPDPARNGEVVERWVRLIGAYRRRYGRMLSKNTREWWQQLACATAIRIEARVGWSELDCSALGRLPSLPPALEFVVHLWAKSAARVRAEGLAVLSASFNKDGGFVEARLRLARATRGPAHPRIMVEEGT